MVEGAPSDTELRDELAELIRYNADEIAAKLEREYVLSYPNSRANNMDVAYIHRWTLSEIESIAYLMETNDPEARTYRGSLGDAVEDPFEPELTSFFSFVTSSLFQARHIAPIVFRCARRDPRHAQALIGLFETTVQQSVAYNCELFSRSITAPGSLSRNWDMRSGMTSPDTPAETPAIRYSGDLAPSPSTSFRGSDLLSSREREVANLVCQGRTNGEIAAALGLSQSTVKNHVAHIFDKCNVNTRVELVGLMLSDC